MKLSAPDERHNLNGCQDIETAIDAILELKNKLAKQQTIVDKAIFLLNMSIDRLDDINPDNEQLIVESMELINKVQVNTGVNGE